jgi:uncharacterized protein (TIGR03083 family)
MDHLAYCDALKPGIAHFVKLTTGADPDTPVPTCPQWTLADLLGHIGRVHRWAGYMVGQLSQRRATGKEYDHALPEDRRTYPQWVADGAEPLIATLRAADPDAPMWAWGADQRARFWSRRMVHETTVHRADAELALGLVPEIDPSIAVDGVDEFLDNLPGAAAFAPAVADLRGADETIHLHATDVAGEWVIRLEPDGFSWAHGHGKGDVAVRGAAADLLLFAYGRRRADDADRFEVFGDRDLLARWVRSSAI